MRFFRVMVEHTLLTIGTAIEQRLAGKLKEMHSPARLLRSRLLQFSLTLRLAVHAAKSCLC